MGRREWSYSKLRYHQRGTLFDTGNVGSSRRFPVRQVQRLIPGAYTPEMDCTLVCYPVYLHTRFDFYHLPCFFQLSSALS
jgi:hypothetical protein